MLILNSLNVNRHKILYSFTSEPGLMQYLRNTEYLKKNMPFRNIPGMRNADTPIIEKEDFSEIQILLLKLGQLSLFLYDTFSHIPQLRIGG